MGKPKAPSPPDPYETASAQTGQSIGTAIANQVLGNVNQVTPNGSLTYDQTGTSNWTDPTSGKSYDLPQYTATQTLSPQQQKLQNKQNRAQINLAGLAKDQSKRLGSILGAPLDLSAAPGVKSPDFQTLGSGPNLKGINSGPNMQTNFGRGGDITKTYGTNFSKDRRRVENALMARINPSLEQERGRLESQLVNQGLTPGTEAYDRAFSQYGQQANDARYGAILAGGQEQSRLTGLENQRATFENAAQGQQFGQNQALAGFRNDAKQQEYSNQLGARGFNNSVKQQEFGNEATAAGFNNNAAQTGFGNDRALRGDYLSEQYANRNQPINEIAALLGTGQVQNPNFVNTQTPQMPTTDLAGLIGQNYGQQLGAYQQQQANNPWNGVMGGLFGLGQAGIMKSDERLKENIEPVGQMDELPVYEYNYKDDPTTSHIGFMAQDVAKTRPHAVVKMGQFLGVDYGKL